MSLTDEILTAGKIQVAFTEFQTKSSLNITFPSPTLDQSENVRLQPGQSVVFGDDLIGLTLFSPPYPLGNNGSFLILPFGERRRRETDRDRETERERQLGEIMYFYDRIKTDAVFRRTNMGKELFLIMR